MTEPIHIISLGAGVQSSTMALMAARGEITPMPTAAIFADTGDEPDSVYDYLDYLKSMLPFPIHVCQKSILSEHLMDNGKVKKHTVIPCFYRNEEGKPALGKRQCTYNWKIRQIQREVRRITGTQRKRLPEGYITQWIGISLDEVRRMKPSRDKWTENRWPLIEHRMSRHDCITWINSNGYRMPGKSACVYCPYQRKDQWAAHKTNPKSWAKILYVDAQLALKGEYLTTDLKRIEDIDFDDDGGQLDLFNNECEGLCGV